MSLQQTLQVFELIDNAYVSGQDVVDLFASYPGIRASTLRASGPKGATDFVRIDIPAAPVKTRVGMRQPWALSAGWAASVRGLRASAWCPTATGQLPRLPAR
jgi:hypothetical protein